MEHLSQADARRIALAAQGFGQPRAAGPPGPDDLVAAVRRLGLVQLDSVNVLCRSHYLAAELSELAGWLGLRQVLVNDRGDLAAELAAVGMPGQIRPIFLNGP